MQPNGRSFSFLNDHVVVHFLKGDILSKLLHIHFPWYLELTWHRLLYTLHDIFSFMLLFIIKGGLCPQIVTVLNHALTYQVAVVIKLDHKLLWLS